MLFNNHQDVLDHDKTEMEREEDASRMLSILQKEKSRSRRLSSRTCGKSRTKQSLASEGREARDSSTSSMSGQEENTEVIRSRVKRSGPSKKRNRDDKDDNSPTESLKSLKVSISRNDARLAKDGPLASLADHRARRRHPLLLARGMRSPALRRRRRRPRRA